jgi:hypothetical protein
MYQTELATNATNDGDGQVVHVTHGILLDRVAPVEV